LRNAESILKDLHRIAVDNHRCFGCGQEHDCSIHGCAIIREAEALIGKLQADLSQSEVARSDLGKRLAEAQQSLHEVKSELDRLLADVRGLVDVCSLCANTDSIPDCELDGECEKCETPCACHNCDEKASNFVWKRAAGIGGE